jgi:hypothetical protein
MWAEIVQALPVGLSEAVGSMGLKQLLAWLRNRKGINDELLHDLESVEAGNPPTRSAEALAEELTLILLKAQPESFSQIAVGHSSSQQIVTGSGIAVKTGGDVYINHPFRAKAPGKSCLDLLE